MVHSISSVKMAVMARYLSAGRLPQTITEEAGRQKLVSQYIHKQLCEADEANLLDEKDMHVFDLKPMTDPLHLVCCNACKKPVKASQYAVHAELCRSIISTEEFLAERNGDLGPKRPPRTERKRSKATGNQMSPIVAQEHNESMDPSDTAAFRSRSKKQDGSVSSLTVDMKDGQRRTNMANTQGRCLTTPSAKDAAAVIMPLSKRPKLVAADTVQPSDGIVTGQDVCNGSSSKSSLSYVPAPLATKIYYSQRNNGLRAALSYMYHGGSTRHCSDEARPKVPEGSLMTCEVISPSRIISEEQLVKQAQEKSNMHTLPSAQNPNQTIGEHPGVFLGQTRGCQPVISLPHQLIANDILNSQRNAAEMRTNMYSSKPYPLTTNSGAPLASVEQTDGGVPVV